MQRWMTGLLVVIVTACGAERAPERVETTSPPPSVMGSTREKGGELVPLEAQATPIAAGNRVAWTKAHVERLYREADAWIQAERRAEEAASDSDSEGGEVAPSLIRPPSGSSSIDTGYRDVTEVYPADWSAGFINGYPCGGDLPPCYVMARESGGNPYAFNAGGCGGTNCYGLWQFAGSWDCQLGNPCGIGSWTVEQQNAAARALWQNGAGCSHWSACP